MSFKTRYLLHRQGRNQFGDPGMGPRPTYKRSAADRKRDKQMIDLHRTLNEKFAATYGAAWLSRFEGLSQADVWKKVHPQGKPSLSTFRSRAKDFPSFNEHLLFLLVSAKRHSLSALGVSKQEIEAEMAKYAECGRYAVTYGDSKRTLFSA